MKRDFEKEYREYMKNTTPDLWERIEAGLDEKDTADRTETDRNQKPAGIYYRHRTLFKILPAAACICILAAAGALIPGMRSRQASAPVDSAGEISADMSEKSAAPEAVTTAGRTEAHTGNLNEKSVSSDADTGPAAEMIADMAVAEQAVGLAAPAGGEEEEIFAENEEFEYEEIGYAPDAAMEMSEEMTFAGSMMPGPGTGSESYGHKEENGFSLVSVNPVSTFSADVDTASYANVRRMIEDGWGLESIYPDAVRTEEFINYFHYDLNLPEGEEPFGITAEIAACPWNTEHQLMLIGLRTEAIDLSEAPAENLVFLLDVSGSMADDDKLPLLQRAFAELTAQLDEEDTVSIVTYANDVEVVLEGVKGNEQQTILDAIEGLSPEGGTYGEGGIQKAYALAERYFLPEGNNRVLLATDGDLNIGISEPDQLEKLIREKRESGVYLSVLGFGTGNVRDDNMERLADCGNGNYSYIDSVLEARKVLVEELGANFHTVAEDVKLQIEFNPETVNAYRQLGYENRQLNAVDFADDTKDAGEIGAGHSMVVLYELIPAGSAQAVELKYRTDRETAFADEYGTLKIRYKEPGSTASVETERIIDKTAFTQTPDEDFVFAALAAEFAMVLKDSPNKGTSSLENILATCKELDLKDEYRQEFYYLVRLLAKREA